MVRCPHCRYEGEASSFEFEPIRADATYEQSDTGVVTCPHGGAALGGYSYRYREERA